MISTSRAQRAGGKGGATSTIFPIAILLAVTIAFYWKILLTHQFSLLTGYEGVNQAYAWLNFWVGGIKQGNWPVWDPYTFSGHVFSGEMQTAAFYPINLLYVLFPFNRNGVLSPELYHVMYALAHFLTAYFTFCLARELQLSVFAGLIAGICFSFGGVVGRLPEWPHLLDSAMWLPLIFLCLLRAMQARYPGGTVLYSSLCGLSLGMSVLAGGLHFAIMQAIVVFSATIFYYYQRRSDWPGSAWRRSILIIGMAGVIACASGSVQLLPSVEYSHRALRFLGATAVPAAERIPYLDTSNGVFAHSVFGLLVPLAFGGQLSSGEFLNPYLGAFPLLLAVIGVWKNWTRLWVRYLSALAIAAFLYSLGGVSFLHGLLYALTPFLSIAREADRFMYLADFALAILAAFGVETLFSYGARQSEWGGLNQALKWIVLAGVVAFAVPALFGQPPPSPWISLSLLLIGVSCALFQYIVRGHIGVWPRFLAVALILFDLNAFDWSAMNVNQLTARKENQMDRLLTMRGAVGYLKSRPGLFRVDVATDSAPNVGDLFHVQATGGSGVTLLSDYARVMARQDLLNVRYLIKPASAVDPGAVYQDAFWKVYENPGAYPRAWLVHETAVESSPENLWKRLDSPLTDPRHVALLGSRLPAGLEPASESAVADRVNFDRYTANRQELRVSAQSRGMLVVSEIYYPGWKATINGQPTDMWKVDGALRGIVVPGGTSRVIFSYEPVSIYAGAALTIISFGAVLGAFVLARANRYFAAV